MPDDPSHDVLVIRICELATRHAAAFAAALEAWPAQLRSREHEAQAARDVLRREHETTDGPWPTFPHGALIDGGTPEPTPRVSGPFAPDWLPVRPLSLAEQAAHLAALHDAHCACDRKLGPWQARANAMLARGESSDELLELLIHAGWFARFVLAARDDKHVKLAHIEPMLAAVEAAIAVAVEATAAPPHRKRRGRPADTDADEDARLCAHWQAAKAAGTATHEDFARDRGLRVDDVRRAIERHRKRHK